MSNAPRSSKTTVTVLLKNVEIAASHICFTGDAIALLSRYTAKGTVLNLDDWHWHEERRGNEIFYIITNIRKLNA